MVSVELGGFAVALDDRPLVTPGKTPLRVPSRALAAGIAAEWQAVEAEIRPEAMPLTRAANTAIDRVRPDPGPLIATLADYGGSDLICYRAEGPDALRDRQAEAWDPLLEWSARVLSAPLVPVTGVMFHPQPADSLAALRAAVAAHDPFALTGLERARDALGLAGDRARGRARGPERRRGLAAVAHRRDLAGRAMGP